MNEAYQRRAEKREAFFKKYPKLREQIYSEYEDGEDDEPDTWMVRRVAPFAVLIFAFTLLFGATWLFLGNKKYDNHYYWDLTTSKICEIQIPENDCIYTFDLNQSFSGYVEPEYSELEVELLAHDYDHVYSFYKDLWLERHSDEEGGTAIYKDTEMSFDLSIKEAGTYYLRINSYNNNESPISLNLYKRYSSSVYFSYGTYFFLGLTLIIFIFEGYWGDPFALIGAFRKVRSLKKNKLFIFTCSVFCLIYFTFLMLNITEYGFPKVGDVNELPGYLYPKNEVIYIG